MKLLSLSQYLFVATLSGVSFAEEPPPLAGPAAAPAAPAAAAPAPAATAAFNPDEISKSATRKYQQGQYSEAAGELLDALSTCDSLTRTACPDEKKAMFYRDLGIVYAGGLDKHHDGVKAFGEALRLDPKVDLPRILDTPPVRAAYDEASGAKAPVPAVASAGAVASDEAKASDTGPRYAAGDVLLRVDGRLRVSGLSNGASSSRAAAQIGVELGALVHPGASPFVVGAAGEISDNVIPANGTTTTVATDYGSWSMAALLGGVFRGTRNKGYVAAGVGIQGLPTFGQVAPMTRVLGGACFGGFDFGGGFDAGFYQGTQFYSFGVHLGWGTYLH